jgi:hypothetical protein
VSKPPPTDDAPTISAAAGAAAAGATMIVFGRRYAVPATRLKRRIVGWSFIAGGMLSFLPVLGPWMFPVGFVILSVDSPRMRRSRRRMTIAIGRRWPKLNAAMMPRRK